MHTHTHTCIYVYINISIHICTYIVHTPTLFLRLKLSSCFALVMPAAPVNSPSAAFCGELLIGRFLMYGSAFIFTVKSSHEMNSCMFNMSEKMIILQESTVGFFLSDPECGAEQNVLFVTFCRPSQKSQSVHVSQSRCLGVARDPRLAVVRGRPGWTLSAACPERDCGRKRLIS